MSKSNWERRLKSISTNPQRKATAASFDLATLSLRDGVICRGLWLGWDKSGLGMVRSGKKIFHGKLISQVCNDMGH